MNYRDSLQLNGLNIPIFIYVERRRSSRVSFTSKGINLRLPISMRQTEIEDQIKWCKNWARKAINKKPSIAYRYVDRNYKDGSTVSVYDQKLKIIIQKSNNKTIRVSIVDDEIIFKSPPNININTATIKRGIIKTLNNHYHEKIKARVLYINNLTVKKEVSNFTIKYLKSQWGNCGSNGHVKLSTRTLLLPEKIQNAIILHELVHLVHFDHSPAFYKTLETFMPDYKIRDKWIKEYEGMVDF